MLIALMRDGTFWTALSALATLAAVIVAIVVPWVAHGRAKRDALDVANAALKVLQQELKAVAEQADSASELARRLASGVLHPDPSGSGDFVRKLKAFEVRKLKDLAHIEFPTLQAFGDRIRGAKPDLALSVMSGYGELMRARLILQSIVNHWTEGQSPFADDLLAYGKAADTISCAGRRAATRIDSSLR
ncbi:hypothetical protein AB7849_03880 [Rhodanobacter sp. 115]|uniref:hypothetical protein n=1 Tax=Rhodanobacter sp. FW021-MT20 TaxID=1162282 RepID=UPI0012FA5DCC